MSTKHNIITFLLLLLLISSPRTLFCVSTTNSPPTVCIVGSGIAGSSVAHFLRRYSTPALSDEIQIRIFERSGVVGGRMATVSVAGDTFEAGASILHSKNYHAVNFTQLVGLKMKRPPKSEDSMSIGIWDGNRFVFRTLQVNSKSPLVQKIVSFANSIYLFIRYGSSLLKMERFVESAVDRFLKYYEDFDTRPVFETVEEMLKWAGLFNLTTRTLQDELIDAKLSVSLIDELVTVRYPTRIFLDCTLSFTFSLMRMCLVLQQCSFLEKT
ncbi:hypothetical protein SLEP1_g17139 [Rubroshorea leprosula]|uniref:Prenylcysteine lyase domain-containing protein n=1 Tax=Rubroshorea leprosula TaxID=152421 RepID=A0AAV5IX08_9ROSI|nr:hypothetical protein SLEP1_g17139 [Rubroshorea leprosula]